MVGLTFDHHLQKRAMKQIAVYCRVSSKRQDTRSQEPDLKRWVEAHADGTPVVWYRDKFTGKEWIDLAGTSSMRSFVRAM